MAFNKSLLLAIALALCAQVSLAQYAGFQTNGTAFSRGELSETGEFLYISDYELREVKGVYRTISDQYPQSVYTAITNNTFPNCASNTGVYNYARLDSTAPQFVVLTGNTTTIFRSNANLQRSTFGEIKQNGTFLTTRSSAGVVSCTHWAPYVDLSTGELMVESLSMTQWARNATNANAAPVRTSLNCQLTGDELVGCYTGRVPGSTGAVTIASTSGTVVSVTKQKYQCLNGECLRFSPKWAAASPAYGG